MNESIDVSWIDAVPVTLVMLSLVVVVFLAALAYYRRQERKEK